MNSLFKKSVVMFIFLALVMTSVVVWASDIKDISKNETVTKSQFLAFQDINNEGTIKGDLFAAGDSVSSSGTVEGDLIAGARNINSSGTVSGDVIGGANTLEISGPVNGNVRCGAANVTISGNVGKNVNIFAGNTNILSTSQIDGNLLALGEYVRVDGKVKGNTKIDGNRITLSGEFFGDVDINLESPSSINMKNGTLGKDYSGSLTVLSGTIIHGKLTYKTPIKAEIQSGAQVGNQEWIEVSRTADHNQTSAMGSLWSFLKLLMSTAIYFLIALLLIKLFPANFKKQSELIAQKPFKTMSIGLAGVFSPVLVLIAWIIVLALSILFASPVVGIILGLISIVFYIVLFYLATISVSLWLGNLFLKERYNVAARLALGLGTISIVVFLFNLLKNLSVVGNLFGFLAFIITYVILLAGTGALLMTLKDSILSLRKCDVDVKKENVL